MITIATLKYLAHLSGTPVESLDTPRGRALAVFHVAMQLKGVKWYANDTLVVVRYCGAGDYCATTFTSPR